MRLGIRQCIASAAVFGAVMFALISVDGRVRERFSDLVDGGSTVSSWTSRASDLGGALALAVKDQSIENAPIVVFATVGAVLVLFMVRT
jgi:hypothetical protein